MRLKLSRAQLEKFLPDAESIKQFEQLFSTANTISDNQLEEVTLSADTAEFTAQEALALFSALAHEVSLTSTRPEQALNTLSQVAQDLALSIPQQSDLSGIRHDLDMLLTAPPAPPVKRSRHGMFLDTTTQTAAVANTAYPITYNTTSLSKGVYIGATTSRIYVDEPGVYDFQFSIQLDKSTGGTANFWIWSAINGTDVANSASQIQVQGNNAEIFSAANFFLDLKAGDYAEFKFAVSDTSVQLAAFAAAAPVPAIPSIIVTVSNNI